MKQVSLKNKNGEKVLPDFITDDLSSNSHVKVPSAYAVNKALSGTVLYKDETGTVGDITLNDNLTNYKKIEIEFSQSNWSYIQTFGTDKVYITLVANNLYDSTSVQNIYQTYILNGNTMKKQYGTWNINDGAFTEDKTMLTITKIIGYK